MVRPAEGTSRTNARTRKGSVMPMSTVGSSRPRKWSGTRAPGRAVEPGAPQVEQVVVEPAARGAEGADRQLQQAEGAQRHAGRRADGQPAAEQAAEAEPRHERGHDHRHRVDADAAVQGQDALPRDLVHEARGSAQDEGRGDEELRAAQAPAAGRVVGRCRLRHAGGAPYRLGRGQVKRVASMPPTSWRPGWPRPPSPREPGASGRSPHPWRSSALRDF